MSGYLHELYADALAEFGSPIRLSGCGGWLLKRPIPGVSEFDAMGCYPLFTCANWESLHDDLEKLPENILSVALVVDPLGNYSESYLRQCFRDVVIPFKEHFIVDLSSAPDTFISKHHRYYAQRALRDVRVERCEQPMQFVDDWTRLYAELIERHRISGMSAFSNASFAKQLTVPGIVMLRAIHDEATVAMNLWYVQGNIAYYHLAVSDQKGYQLNASYALMSFALDHFAESRIRWLDLGAGAGLSNNGSDGLNRFKRGWSNATRPTFFCGRIFDRQKYAEIVKSFAIPETSYFPAYRAGEFK